MGGQVRGYRPGRVAWPVSAAATPYSAGVLCACVLQGLVDRSGQDAYGIVVGRGRAVDCERDDHAGAGEIIVRDPVADGLALVIPDGSGLGAGLLLDAEPVAGRVGEGGAGDGLAGGLGHQGARVVGDLRGTADDDAGAFPGPLGGVEGYFLGHPPVLVERRPVNGP